MAVIFMEQSETGQIGNNLGTQSLSINTSVTAGPWSARSIKFTTTSGYVRQTWAASAANFYGQAWVRTQLGSLTYGLFQFEDSAGVVLCTLAIDRVSGHFKAYKGSSGGTLLGTGTFTILADVWMYLQWHVVLHDTAGVFTLKVNGTTDIDLSGVDTIATGGAATADRWAYTAGGDAATYLDDLVITDETGMDNITYPDYLGIQALMPSAAGDNTGLTPSAGSNYQCVDELPANDATDYVYDSILNDYDLYNIPSTRWSTVAAVGLALRVSKSDAGAANIAHMLKIDTDGSGTADELDTGPDIALSTSWTDELKIYNRQPDDAGATSWTAAKVAALQVGAKVR